MATNGVYGTNVGANIDPLNDVEIWYSYSPTRHASDVGKSGFEMLPSSYLDDNRMGLDGLYNLNLPLNKFNKKGFYTVYIKPKEIPVVIKDVSVLSSYANVRGIILDIEEVNDNDYFCSLLRTNNALVGYRIKYDDDPSLYRIITSNNKVEPVVQNIVDVNSKSTRYRFNDSSSLVFITVTPSSASSFKANSEPFIGNVTDRIKIVNTKFEPIMLDIEMVENDIDTLTTLVNGSQLRDLDNGLLTTFNKQNEIVAQHEFFTMKQDGVEIFEVKHNKENSIDFSQTLEDKI